jgi:hypothetical protein
MPTKRLPPQERTRAASADSDAMHPPKGRIATAVSFQGLVHYVATDTASARARARTYYSALISTLRR